MFETCDTQCTQECGILVYWRWTGLCWWLCRSHQPWHPVCFLPVPFLPWVSRPLHMMYTMLYPVFPSALDGPHFPTLKALYTLYFKENWHCRIWVGFCTRFTVQNLECTENKEENKIPWNLPLWHFVGPSSCVFCARVCIYTHSHWDFHVCVFLKNWDPIGHRVLWLAFLNKILLGCGFTGCLVL